MGHGDQATAAVGGPVGDPAIVGTAHRLRVFGIVGIGLPGQRETRIDDRSVEPFEVKPFEAILGVRGAQWKVVAVTNAGIEVDGGAGHFAHLGNVAEVAATVDTRGDAVDFEIFEVVLVGFQANRAIAILGLAVALPQGLVLEDMAVGVDRARILQLVNLFLGVAHTRLDSKRVIVTWLGFTILDWRPAVKSVSAGAAVRDGGAPRARRACAASPDGAGARARDRRAAVPRSGRSHSSWFRCQ